MRLSTALATLLPSFALTTRASAADAVDAVAGLGTGHQIVLTSLMIGVVGAALASTIGMMRARRRAEEALQRLTLENADLRAIADRNEALLDAEDQVILAWGRGDEAPILTGALGPAAAAPKTRASFLAFGTWLSPASAADLDRRIEALRDRGTPFTIELVTSSRTYVEACGRTGGGRPFLRFRDLTAERLDFARAREETQRLGDDLATFRALFEALPIPAWIRDMSGRLRSVNTAYARAVDLPDAGTAVAQGAELLDRAGREALDQRRAGTVAQAERLSVVVAGQRRSFDVVEARATNGAAGLAVDMTDLDRVEAEFKRTVDFHARTLDQLATAVAIFGADKRLQFYNAAYRTLWGLDTVFLESQPEDAAILDELRAARRLPEQADWRGWKRDMLSGYTALEAREHWLHLPDGQTLRVIANPHPQGGVTYVYENVTKTLELEAQNNTLLRVQGETLDHLSEGVVVFGSDGRLRLANSRFAAMWRLDATTLQRHPHVADIVGDCSRLHGDAALWTDLKIAVTGLADSRTPTSRRLERADGMVMDVATVPLPDGATLVTFVNVTDTVNVERALTEKNDALEESDRIKTDFVGLVSYELRSPLTNVIGFAHLLADDRTGPMTERQQEYFGHIMASSQALMAIVDDILDLATIDAGTMALQLDTVDIRGIIASAIDGVQDRTAATGAQILTEVDDRLEVCRADPQRLRQVLFNLLTNALRYSRAGGTVRVHAERAGEELHLSVSDQGPGIPADQVKAVFERFYARPKGGQRGGAGLGLSLVKSFVELHGGSVSISSVEGQGTTVLCRLPLEPTASRPGQRDAAE